MTDTIRVNTELLERCAGELKIAAQGFGDAASILAGLNTGEEWWTKMGRFTALPLKDEATSADMGADAGSAVRAMMSVMRRYDGRMTGLGEKTAKAAAMFNEAENILHGKANDQRAATVPPGASHHVAGGIIGSWSTIVDDWFNKWKNSHNNDKRKNTKPDIFDDSQDALKKYGGDQGAPVQDVENYDRYREIISRNTGKTLKDDDLEMYLEGMNSEGCGYVAMVNAIFQQYRGREKAFERDFGFPMYKDGNLNYNELLVDIYSSTDNYNKKWYGKGYFDPKEDYDKKEDGSYKNYDYYTDTSRYGTTEKKWEARMEKYLADHHIKGEVKNFDNNIFTGKPSITPSNCQSYINKYGNLFIAANDFTLHTSPDKSDAGEYYGGGHAMTIIGEENGMFVVSSWGNKYYLDPADCENLWFQAVEFK